MVNLRPGVRLFSSACTTEIMVVKGSGDFDLRCGGKPMATEPVERGEPQEPHVEGTLMGKRYVNSDGSLEVLCTKPGSGSLSLAKEPLRYKESKALPSSD